MLRYSIAISATPLNVEDICKAGGKNKRYHLQSHVQPTNFVRNYNLAVFGKSTNTFDICQQSVRQMAVVNFRLASSTIHQLNRDLRVSFVDSLSNFGEENQADETLINDDYVLGGILGLFTGMSLLSIVEIIFWSLKLMRTYFSKKK